MTKLKKILMLISRLIMEILVMMLLNNKVIDNFNFAFNLIISTFYISKLTF